MDKQLALMDRFDVVVIGGGIGGYTCAIRASQLGKKVALIEQREIGGTCLNRGCIPTKALLRSAELYDLFKSSEEFGIRAESISFDMRKMMDRKNGVVSKLRGGVELLLKRANVTVVKGKGEILDESRVKANGDVMESENTVIATGSEPAQMLGTDGKSVLTSDDALTMEEIPASMLIVGAGAIGVEFATLLSSLGTKVTMLEMMDHVLPALNDDKTTKLLSSALRRRGVEIKTGSKIERIEKEDRVTAVLESGDRVSSDRALISIGRKLNSQGLEALVKTEKGRIIVNERMETSVKGIYAIGDVIGGLMLAHKAMHEGIVAAENIADAERAMDYSVIPSVVYSRPEVAWVGLTEKDVKDPKIGECPFSANGKALCEGDSYGNTRIVADRGGRIVGAQVIGPQASLLIEEVALAIKSKATLEDIAELVHPHPTLSEVIFEACSRALGN
jgi:dihydrolipoamide dehydrogenase